MGAEKRGCAVDRFLLGPAAPVCPLGGMLPNAKPASKFSGQFRFPGPDFLKNIMQPAKTRALSYPIL